MVVKIRTETGILSRLKLLNKFFVEFLTFFSKTGAVQYNALQNFHQRVDLTLCRIKFINDDDFFDPSKHNILT